MGPHLLDAGALHLLQFRAFLFGHPLQLLLPLLRERCDLHDQQVLEARPWRRAVPELLELEPSQILDDINLFPVVDVQLVGNDHLNEPGTIVEQVALQRELVDQVLLAQVIILQTNIRELLADLDCTLVLADLASAIEQHHVGLVDATPQLEIVLDGTVLDSFDVVRSHLQGEVYVLVRVVFPDILHLDLRRLVAAREHGVKELLVVLCPLAHRQLLDLKAVVCLVVLAPRIIRALAQRLDGARESAVPGFHGLHLLLGDPEAQVFNDGQGVVVRDVRAPTCADAGGSVHEHHRDDGHIPMRLNALSIFLQVGQHGVIKRGEDEPGPRHQPRVDVPGACVVAAALRAGAELARRGQQVDVVRAYEVLRHRDDGARQGGLSVVVGAVLADVADQLCNLDVRAKIPLEGAIQDLALGRLHAVHDRGHAAHDAVLGELDELQVDEVLVCDGRLRVIHEGALLVVVHPRLSVVRARFAECHVDHLAILLRLPLEVQAVLLHGREVLFSLGRGAGSETLVVLDVPTPSQIVLLLPSLILGLREEGDRILSTLADLDDRGDELLHEAAVHEEVRPPEVEEVQKQALDVRTVVILVSHDHHRAVAHLVVVALGAEGEAQDLDHGHDFPVLCNLPLCHVADVQQLAAQREDTVAVAADDAETGDGQGLCTVTLREDQRAVLGVLPSGVVRVLQLRDAQNALALGAALRGLVHLRRHLGLRLGDDGVDDVGLVDHLIDEGL
mmetsp:Transcript_53685/g.174598  ORF Transcript_53685/g.174598 Transcript_53685/m.174598 type:complete len:732 (+) Transcript_53685:776-2971(+)